MKIASILNNSGDIMRNAYYENKSLPYYTISAGNLTTDPHFHKEIELVYVVEGSTVAYADADCFTVNKGDIYISFPNQIHHYEHTVIGEYIVIILNPDILFGIKDLFYDNIPKSNVVFSDADSEIHNIISAYKKCDGKYKSTMQVGFLNEFMGHLLPHLALKSRVSSDNTTLQNIFKYCSDNFAGKITLKDVSDNLHISRYHISHILNSKVGIGFSEYINTLRINRACELLEETDKKTTEISEEVGFGSIRSFNREFLEQLGITPLKYRKKIKTS